MEQNEKNKIAITDPHCHLWDLSLGYHGWLSDRESELLGSLKPLNKNYLLDDYLEDTKEFVLDKFVHVEAVSTLYAKQEVESLLHLSNKTDKLGGIVAGADLLDPGVEKLLEYYSSVPLVKGIRQILSWHENSKYRATDRSDDLVNPLWERRFSLLKKYPLSFDMQLCPTQMQEAYQLAKKYDDTKIILNHAGSPIEEDYPVWIKGIKKLAACHNVSVKLSGFGMLNHHWTAKTIKPIIHDVIEHFGVDRCMFASNFPVDKLYCNFSSMMQAYHATVEDFSVNEKEKLFSKTAKLVYRIHE